MAAVAKAIGTIAKDRTTDSGARYSFRGIDDVLDAIHEPLTEEEVTPYPKIVNVQRDDRVSQVTDDRGNTKERYQSVVTLTLGIRFVGPDGDEQYAEAVAEAQDYGDKAVAKAESVAYRTIMIQVFSIPVSDPNVVDHETENDERSAARPPRQGYAASQGDSGGARGESGAPSNLASEKQVGMIQGLFREIGLTEREAKHAYVERQTGKTVASLLELSKRDASSLIEKMQAEKETKQDVSQKDV